MAQNREKDETLDLKVPSETPLPLSCPDNCKKIPSPSPSSRPDIARFDPVSAQVDLGSARSRPDREGEGVDKPGETMLLKRKREMMGSPVHNASASKAVNRCWGCGKRVGLTGFRCRCGELFCGEHRYSDRHDCGYDYKAAGREAIARENPVVRAAKILKI